MDCRFDPAFDTRSASIPDGFRPLRHRAERKPPPVRQDTDHGARAIGGAGGRTRSADLPATNSRDGRERHRSRLQPRCTGLEGHDGNARRAPARRTRRNTLQTEHRPRGCRRSIRLYIEPRFSTHEGTNHDPTRYRGAVPCLVGRAVAALAADPNVGAKSGGLISTWALSNAVTEYPSKSDFLQFLSVHGNWSTPVRISTSSGAPRHTRSRRDAGGWTRVLTRARRRYGRSSLRSFPGRSSGPRGPDRGPGRSI